MHACFPIFWIFRVMGYRYPPIYIYTHTLTRIFKHMHSCFESHATPPVIWGINICTCIHIYICLYAHTLIYVSQHIPHVFRARWHRPSPGAYMFAYVCIYIYLYVKLMRTHSLIYSNTCTHICRVTGHQPSSGATAGCCGVRRKFCAQTRRGDAGFRDIYLYVHMCVYTWSLSMRTCWGLTKVSRANSKRRCRVLWC